MGKSTAADCLCQHGLPVVDTDAIAREVVEPGQPALAEIQQAFGGSVLGPDGRLRRKELARIVFADEARRKELEAIVHPRIRQRWRQQTEEMRAQGVAVAVVVIPLLFETNARPEVDEVICVACSRQTQLQRLLPRGWSAHEIEQRNRSQWPIDKKMAAAQFVVWNEGGLAVHAEQIERILACIRTKGQRAEGRGPISVRQEDDA